MGSGLDPGPKKAALAEKLQTCDKVDIVSDCWIGGPCFSGDCIVAFSPNIGAEGRRVRGNLGHHFGNIFVSLKIEIVQTVL